MPLHKLRRAVSGSEKRAAYDSTIEIEDASNGEQSQAVTIPADAKLVVVMFAARASDNNMGTQTVTLGGASPDYTPRAWVQNTNRNGVAIYGFLTANTGTGSQTWVSSFSGNSGIGSHVNFFFFSAGNYNATTPFGTAQLTEESSNGESTSVTYTPTSSLPLILANHSAANSSGTYTGHSGTNLTISNDFDDSNTYYGCGYNNTLENAGSTVFTLTADGVNCSYASMALVEMLSV